MNLRFRVANFITGGALKSLRDDVRYSEAGLSVLRDSVNVLSAAGEGGWRATGDVTQTWTRADIKLIALQAQEFYTHYSLIKRGVNVSVDYVFGQGFTLSSADESVQKVLSDFCTDLRNKAVVTEPEAAAKRDIECQIGGNLFFAAYTDETHGHVSIRTFHANTIEDIVRNPDDCEEPWFYQRTCTTEQLNTETGQLNVVTKTIYHPDVNYRPADKMPTIGGHEVMWDAPVFHFKPTAILSQKFGICEFFSAGPWAKSYKSFLEDRLTVARALSEFCLKFSQKTGGAIKQTLGDLGSAIAARLSQGRSRAGDRAGEEESTAGNAIGFGAGGDMQAVSVQGATINPDEGRRVALMVFADFGFPETFWGDASVGSLATAQSLDRPTALKIERRRQFWKDVLHSLALYAVMQAAQASDNEFEANVTYRGNTPVVTLPDGEPVVIEVSFPDIIEQDITKTVSAIDTASKHIPDPKINAGLMLNALRVKNPEEALKNMKFPDPAKEPPAPDPKADPAQKPEPTK